ncbi:MAG: DUF924 domain-containing protein [Proteobacteria bacterium]|nr:DUF924 domain-containing protein [Pseudomonadota bacterium]
MSNRIEDILQFWFGAFPTPYTADVSKMDMWFKSGAAYDSEIFLKFGVDYDKAIKGELDHWPDSYRGRLALIILLDQFSRHIHRGDALAFAQDEKAQALCIDGIAAGDDSKCHSIERSFFYLPLEHAEDIEKQNLCVKAYSQLVEDVPEEYRRPFEMNLQYAKDHHYVIERFGRFPELNEIIGRESTEEERAFIASGEYFFL